MKRGVWRATACCLTVAVSLAGNTVLAFADGVETQLAGVGVDIASQQQAAAEAGVVLVEPSEYDTVAVAQCEEYVNIRDAASTDGNVLGKLYNNSSATIIGKEGEWYLVQSGSVTGYVHSAYFATGDDAAWLATQVGTEVATVNTSGLMVRTDASTDSDIITMVGDAEVLEVQEDCGDWVKVTLDDDVEGYVAKEYIETETLFSQAESTEEEAARIEAENQAWLDYLAEQEAIRQAEEQAWLDYLAQQEAEQEAANQAWLEYLAQQEAEQYAAQAEADAAYQEYLNQQAAADQAAADAAYQAQVAAEAQAAADAAAAQEDEWARQQAQAEADAAYQEYLNQQAAAEQAAAEAAYQAQLQAEAAAAAEQAAAEQAAAEQAAAEQAAAEQAAAEQASSSSSLRESVVNYALQFVGNPYVYGGTSLTNGTDCSGFTLSVMANFGVSLPRTAAEQANCGTPVDISAVQPGDLLFYSDGSGIGHVSMYIGNGQVVHASSSTTGIIVSSMSYRTPCCARSFL
ncbi:MAG: SH3 domain-containing C40 family peptidase [Eubacteriales bacterium]|nr:SH3 domain-containing C40 family peptidase [Eubacteriales bacterium]